MNFYNVCYVYIYMNYIKCNFVELNRNLFIVKYYIEKFLNVRFNFEVLLFIELIVVL